MCVEGILKFANKLLGAVLLATLLRATQPLLCLVKSKVIYYHGTILSVLNDFTSET